MKKVLIIVFGAAAVTLALPVILPVVCVQHGLHLHRMRKAARQCRCTLCGQILGMGSLQLADTRWGEHVRELLRRHPGARFRLVRDMHASCASCGRSHRYDDRARTFK